MNVKKYLSLAIFAAAFVFLSTFSISAQEMMKKAETDKPVVAIIKADWCPYCKRIDPVVSGLMKEYGEKLNFVVFDVTNDETIKASKEKAESLGLSDFFKNYKGKTSTVAVLKDKEIVYKTSNNGNRADYVTAFDKSLQ